jgi:hypothetical protein
VFLVVRNTAIQETSVLGEAALTDLRRLTQARPARTRDCHSLGVTSFVLIWRTNVVNGASWGTGDNICHRECYNRCVYDSTLGQLGALAEQRWGMVTTAQAATVGVSRQQLARMAASGAIERVAQGVYRMAGAPHQNHEAIYATWLALGGATMPKTEAGTPALVAAGISAAIAHDLGDFFLDGFDFMVPARKGTRLPGVRLRIRRLTREEVSSVNGLPVLSVERAIADLVEQWTDLSLVAGVVRDAVHGRLLAPDRLATYLEPVARAQKRRDIGKGDGRSVADDLFKLAGIAPEGWAA